MPSKPYSIEDLHRPATEGRSLHDDASAFYREIMKLQTPIVTVPSKAAIAKAIQAMTKSEAEKFGPLLLNLQVTPLKNLWPASVSQPPPTKEGVLWAAAQAPRSTVQQDISSPPLIKKHGRPQGAKKWSQAEVAVLLQVIGIVLPAGSHHWEKVSVQCTQAKKGMYRSGVSCKSKFEKLAFTKCPTGTADIPIHVLQAKQLKEEISGYEVIGFVSGNKSEFDHDDDEYDSTNLLSPSNSGDGVTEVKRPATKKQKTTQMAEAVKVLSAGSCKAADKMSDALENLAASMVHP